VAGMVLEGGRAVEELGERCVGVTMLGQTTPGVMRVRDALVEALRPDIPYETIDAHVDDAEFADVVAARYLTLTQEAAHAG
jgi:uncharacterized protein (UPF0261 family)